MDRLDATEAKNTWSETLDRVRHHGDRIVLRRHGKDAAALVPMEDLELIEALEDKLDLEAARKIVASGEKLIPWETVKRSLGRKKPTSRK
jgi:prevent-host-death family protein